MRPKPLNGQKMQDHIKKRVAEILFEIDAIHVNVETPYTLTSGWCSPVYIDCRKLIAFPEQRQEVMAFAQELLTPVMQSGTDMIAGGETAGIPYAAFLAERFQAPMLYIRKKPKGFGRMAQIEGAMQGRGEKVLLVEDLTTDGKSKIIFANVLRDAGAVVTDVFSVFFYHIFGTSDKIFDDAGLRLHYLTDWPSVLSVIKDKDMFDTAIQTEIEKFIEDPALWSKTHKSTSIGVTL